MRKTGAWTVDYHYSARVGSRYKKQPAANRNDINTDFVTFSAQMPRQAEDVLWLTGREPSDFSDVRKEAWIFNNTARSSSAV